MACRKILKGHLGWVWDVTVSPGDDCTPRLWSVDTGECQLLLTGHLSRVYCIAYSPKGELLASGSEDQTVRLWDITSGEC
jgi:WD40 repeat protein